ncbi:hypothetical protein [Pseudomonas sp. NPDC086278]
MPTLKKASRHYRKNGYAHPSKKPATTTEETDIPTNLKIPMAEFQGFMSY